MNENFVKIHLAYSFFTRVERNRFHSGMTAFGPQMEKLEKIKKVIDTRWEACYNVPVEGRKEDFGSAYKGRLA